MRHTSAAAILLLSFLPALAQQHPNHERGFPADKLVQSFGPDSVNLFNGNLTIAIPIGQTYRVSSALSYGLTLRYSGHIWDYEEVNPPLVQALPNRRSNAGLGWYVSLGRLILPGHVTNETGAANLWVYESPDGNDHVLYPNLHEETPTPGVFYTRDGTYLRMRDIGGGFREVDFPNSTIHKFDANGYLTEIRDRSGNYIRSTYTFSGPSITTWTLTDGHPSEGDRRTQTVHFRSSVYSAFATSVVDRIVLSAFNSQTATWNFAYGTAAIDRGFGHNDTNLPSTVTVEVLTSVSITLPDSSVHSYQMPTSDYNIALPIPGTIKAIKLPTLGRIEWDHSFNTFPDGSSSKTYLRHSIGVSARRMKDASGTLLGTWTFEHTPASAACTGYSRYLTKTVTDPATHKTLYYFSTFSPGDTCANTEGWHTFEYGLPFTRTSSSGGRYLSTEIKHLGTTLKRSSYLTYERDSSAGGGGYLGRETQDSNRRVLASRVVYNDDGNRFAEVAFSNFDGLGHYRQQTTSGSFDSGNDRTEITNFNPSSGTYPGSFVLPLSSAPWTLTTFDYQQQTEGTGNAKQTFCFDSTTGFLLRKRTMKNLSPDAFDLVVRYTSDTKGEMIREEYFGGDTQSLSTSTDLCNLTLPVAQYRIDHTYQWGSLKTSRYYDTTYNVPMSFKSTDYDIDRNTGLVSVSRDISELSMSFEYDTLSRLTWSKPQTGHDGWTQQIYVTATSPTALARVDTKRWNNGGTIILAQSQVFLDAFGRNWKEKQLLANGTWSTRETGLNALGWTTFVSETEPNDPTINKTNFTNFDSFGRPSTITAPDSKVSTMSYTGDRVVSRTMNIRTSGDANNLIETASTTTEIYDRKGRLWQVTEPSGAAGQQVTTQYTYDVGNRMSRVMTTAAEATQNRYFTYDNRGFLTSETLPEKGTSGNGTVSYPSYDARGHLRRKLEGAANGPFDLSYFYDKAERLTSISETGSPFRAWKEFGYASANGVGNWQKGKLVSTARYNYGLPGYSFVRIMETYQYGSVSGRVSRRDTTSDTGDSFSQTFAYDALGNVIEVGGPNCLSPGCNLAGAGASYSYTNGFVTSMPSFVTSITYHANGLPYQVTLANGLIWTQQNDPNHIRRPASISTSGSMGSNWLSGTYRYDGSGNVASMGTDYVFYDTVSRVKEGTALAAGNKLQQYAFDSYGNITSMTTVVNGSPTTRPLATSASTNRLNTATYDVAGNLVSYGSTSYEYDSFNMMTRLTDPNRMQRNLYTADDERILVYDEFTEKYLWSIRDLNGRLISEFLHETFPQDIWSEAQTYIYREDGSVVARDANTLPLRLYYAVDHLGTPRLITDPGRNTWGSHVYYPFGEEATYSGQNSENMKFTGHERDYCCSGSADYVDYQHARHYSPTLGRSQSVDLIWGIPWFPQSWNRFAYVHGNPTNFVDPSGMSRRRAVTRGFSQEFYRPTPSDEGDGEDGGDDDPHPTDEEDLVDPFLGGGAACGLRLVRLAGTATVVAIYVCARGFLEVMDLVPNPFTGQCKDLCVKDYEEEFDKAKKLLKSGKIDKRRYIQLITEAANNLDRCMRNCDGKP